MAQINFYRAEESYGAFSNFSLHPVIIGGLLWPTTEHYFQAQKFEDPDYRQKIRAARSPAVSKRLGKSRNYRVRRDWDAVKERVMRVALYAKFQQYPALRTLLVSTGNRLLVEHTARDGYWGDNGDGRGLNRLGVLLMEVRRGLRY